MPTRKIGLLGLIIAALLLAACGGEATATPVPTRTPAPSPTATLPTAPNPTPTLLKPTMAAPTSTPAPTAMPTLVPTLAPTPTQVATEGELFLQLLNPAEDAVITEIPSIEVIGRTRIDAVVTINDAVVEPDIDGRFSSTVQLEEGPNIIEVLASVASGEQIDLVLVVIYIP